MREQSTSAENDAITIWGRSQERANALPKGAGRTKNRRQRLRMRRGGRRTPTSLHSFSASTNFKVHGYCRHTLILSVKYAGPTEWK